MMILPDFLFWLITGLLSLYPVSKLVKYRDSRKYFNWIELLWRKSEVKSEEVKQKFNNLIIRNEAKIYHHQ
jgi:hypothetical protein